MMVPYTTRIDAAPARPWRYVVGLDSRQRPLLHFDDFEIQFSNSFLIDLYSCKVNTSTLPHNSCAFTLPTIISGPDKVKLASVTSLDRGGEKHLKYSISL